MIINIDFLVYKKMMSYAKFAAGEISGLAKVERDEIRRDIINITDIVLLEQTCSSASTELQSDSIAKFADDMMKEGKDIGDWKCWWHSHGTMNTFWSGTDTNTIESLNPETSFDNYIVSIVVNKDQELLARIDCFEPIRATLDDVEYDVRVDTLGIDELCQQEVKDKIIIPQTTVIVRYPPIPKAISQEDLDNFYDPMEIVGEVDILPLRYVDSTGVYILGKDMKYHKKLRKLSKKDEKDIENAIDALYNPELDRELDRELEKDYKNYMNLHGVNND